MNKIIENKLIEKFKEKGSFSREELYCFFKSFDPGLKTGTFGWRIYDLKKRNILTSIKKGFYTISQKQEYKPWISKEIIKISKKLTELFDDIEYCIWETSFLNEFAQHQSGKKIILIEVERDLMESVFYELKDSLKYDFFINPNETTIDLYLSESENPAVIKRLITRSPIDMQTQKKVKVYTPYLEKILVDLYCEEKLFYFFQGSELVHIYENAIKNYPINFSRLFNYANRRGKEKEIKEYLKSNLQHIVKNLIND